MAMAWYHPLHPSTLRESCLLPPFTRRNAPFELDSRMATAWHHPLHPSTLRESCLLPPFTRFNALVELDSRIATAWHHPLHRSTLRESCLLPPFARRNALFELDSRGRDPTPDRPRTRSCRAASHRQSSNLRHWIVPARRGSQVA